MDPEERERCRRMEKFVAGERGVQALKRPYGASLEHVTFKFTTPPNTTIVFRVTYLFPRRLRMRELITI